jgi:hypothetical protein
MLPERIRTRKAERKRVRTQQIHDRWETQRDALVSGEVTLAELLGHSDDKLLQVANKGLLALRAGKLEHAGKILMGLPLLDPYVPYFHLLVGLYYERVRQPEKALAEYEHAVGQCEAMEPRAELLPHVLMARAKLLTRMGRLRSALAVAQRLTSGEFNIQDGRFHREAAGIRRYLESAAQQGNT